MDTREKLAKLADASQYDLSCACGTDKDDRRHRGKEGLWLYPVSLPRGGKSIMLKTLMSSACVNDCKYCPLRADANAERCGLEPTEIAKAFIEYQRSLHLHGLFLSSGVVRNPDHTMDRMIETAQLLRRKYAYRGYIHLKVI
ncbi:MAG: radical SAM protein, partial [Planctomycetes bacterium]|nr:radical SAM protein [Planctomycetota bacterium]